MTSQPAIIQQLDSARSLALGDGRYYPAILPGVLPLISTNNQDAPLEVLRWGAEFLAETFASPMWPVEEKLPKCLLVLPLLKDYLEMQDAGVVKSAVQAVATIYPLVFKHIINNPNDSNDWQTMANIKSNILRRMDSAPPSVRICCVKFVQQVVLVETPGIIDPRRQDLSDTSLAHVPRDHRLLPTANLEAEASGLLDRLLDIIHGDHSDALLVTATLNTLGTLMQRRPIITNKILSSILQSNPLKLANSPMTPKNRVIMRSMERTTRAVLLNFMKRHNDNPFNPRIQQYLERMNRMRIDVFDETNRKRAAPVEPTDGLDQAKRQRLGADIPGITPAFPPLPPGPVSFAQLFTLTNDKNSTSFDVTAIPQATMMQIITPVLQSIDQNKLNDAVNAVRARYLSLSSKQQRSAADAVAEATGTAVEDDDEYEPDFDGPIEDAEQVNNKLDSAPPDSPLPERVPDAPLAPFKLPTAPPLTEQEIQKYGDSTIQRVFGTISAFEETPQTKGAKPGFNRYAASSFDRDSWITIACRLATRGAAGLDDPEANVKSEYGTVKRKGNFALADTIREALYKYIMYEWRKRIDVATNWLTEEWYNDRVQQESTHTNSNDTTNGEVSDASELKLNYPRWVLRLLDGIVPFVEAGDKLLIRFLSEIPEVNREILERVKKIADDPERVSLSIMVLQYLYMFRPPVRELCVDVLEDLWRSNDRAKPVTQKLLMKWRPEVLQIEENQVKKETANGALEVKAA